MKKLIVIALSLILSATSFAQTGALSITNNSNCTYTIIMHAQSPAMGTPTGHCGDIVSNSFTVTAGATPSWSDPYNFEGAIGWSSWPGTYGTVCGTPCFSGWSWTTYYPTTSWSWSYAEISISGGGSANLGHGCAGSSTPVASLCNASNPNCTISASSTYPFDVTIALW